MHHRVVIQLLIPADCLICLDLYNIFLAVLFISTSSSFYICIFYCLILVDKTDQDRSSWLDVLDQFYKLSDGMYVVLNNAPKLTYLPTIPFDCGVQWSITIGSPV